MNRIFVLALVTTAVAVASAGAVEHNSSSRTRPPRSSARVTDAARALGIGSFGCNCSQTIRDNGVTVWRFRDEPEIRSVVPDGPSEGELRRGDHIVAIDGMLITTRDAGKRFGSITEDEEVKLTIRRGDRTLTRTIVAAATMDDFARQEAMAHGEALALRGESLRLEELAESVESLAEYATELSRIAVMREELAGLAELTELTEIDITLPELPELDLSLIKRINIPEIGILPEGGFGFGLSFSGTVRASQSPPLWEFDGLPTVDNVDKGSPADRAGLERGDLLTHIDGVRLDTDEGGRLFSAVKPGQTVEWTIRRDGGRRTLEMTAEDRVSRDRERERVEAELRSAQEDSAHRLRYSGSIGDTEIEVRGSENLRVTVDEATDEIVIVSRDGTVRLRLTGGN